MAQHFRRNQFKATSNRLEIVAQTEGGRTVSLILSWALYTVELLWVRRQLNSGEAAGEGEKDKQSADPQPGEPAMGNPTGRIKLEFPSQEWLPQLRMNGIMNESPAVFIVFAFYSVLHQPAQAHLIRYLSSHVHAWSLFGCFWVLEEMNQWTMSTITYHYIGECTFKTSNQIFQAGFRMDEMVGMLQVRITRQIQACSNWKSKELAP